MNDEDIRKSAYAKWEAEGRPDGQHDRHWQQSEHEMSNGNAPQTWSADHGGGVSPPTSTGSVLEEQVSEPSNDWPAAGAGQDPGETVPAPVEEFDLPKGDGRRTFQNGDTDRKPTR